MDDREGKALIERDQKVLFIVFDQLRADCLQGALADAIDLPHLNALMADGVTFSRHYTVTVPCGPARASLLTGLYAMNHRSVRNGTPLDRTLDTLPKELRKAGSEPLLFGYTDTSADPRGREASDPALRSYEGVMPGFTELLVMQWQTSYPWTASLLAKGYDVPSDPWDLYRPVSPDPSRAPSLGDPALYRNEDSDTAFLTDQAIAALSVRRRERWCAHVNYIRPHPPFVAPAPYHARYKPDALPQPVAAPVDDERAVHPTVDAAFAKRARSPLAAGFDCPWEGISAADVQTLRAIYLGLVSEVDAHVGRLIESLKESGQYDDTLIIVTSDHGEMLGDHRMWGKECFYDPAFHVPLIIRDPNRRQNAGRVVDAFTETIDIAPTILDWLGRDSPLGFDGRSLLPLMEGRTPDGWRDYAFAELDLGDPEKPTCYQENLGLPMSRCNLAILRERRLKYVHVNGGLPPLLFDMIDDPGETQNLAGDPAYAPELLRLAGRMLDHRMTHADHRLSRLKLTDHGVVAAGPED
ncbi:MAG: alkaline phosphatase family protein [Alphaproteobacteria bacterium]|nr:alkaline phosphatase family protein [Alphaproteobacteria bacterium]